MCNIISTGSLEVSSHEVLFLTPTVAANVISESQKGDQKSGCDLKKCHSKYFPRDWKSDFLFQHANPA